MNRLSLATLTLLSLNSFINCHYSKLHNAIKAENIEEVKLHLLHLKDDINNYDYDSRQTRICGQTPIMCAINKRKEKKGINHKYKKGLITK